VDRQPEGDSRLTSAGGGSTMQKRGSPEGEKGFNLRKHLPYLQHLKRGGKISKKKEERTLTRETNATRNEEKNSIEKRHLPRKEENDLI